MMRLIACSLIVTIGLVAPGAAEERVTVLPEIVIGRGPSAGGATSPGAATTGAGGRTSAPDRCVEVEIGSSRAMDCLNQKLKHEVDRVNPTINLPPIDARSPDTKVGVVNTPGVQQQYGKNFGVSVVPYRPPPPTFSAPRR
jgi:hypothetical protein